MEPGVTGPRGPINLPRRTQGKWSHHCRCRHENNAGDCKKAKQSVGLSHACSIVPVSIKACSSAKHEHASNAPQPFIQLQRISVFFVPQTYLPISAPKQSHPRTDRRCSPVLRDPPAPRPPNPQRLTSRHPDCFVLVAHIPDHVIGRRHGDVPDDENLSGALRRAVSEALEVDQPDFVARACAAALARAEDGLRELVVASDWGRALDAVGAVCGRRCVDTLGGAQRQGDQQELRERRQQDGSRGKGESRNPDNGVDARRRPKPTDSAECFRSGKAVACRPRYEKAQQRTQQNRTETCWAQTKEWRSRKGPSKDHHT